MTEVDTTRRRPPATKPPASLIAKVHVAKKQLGLSEDDYRGLLTRVTGRASSGACTAGELHDVLAACKRLGWKPAGGMNAFGKAHVRKIHALWKEAGVVGAVDIASKEALRAFVMRQTGRSAPEFCTPADANKVTEALKAMIRRRQS